MVNAITIKHLLLQRIKVTQENRKVEQDRLIEKGKDKCHLDYNGILRYGNLIWIPPMGELRKKY